MVFIKFDFKFLMIAPQKAKPEVLKEKQLWGYIYIQINKKIEDWQICYHYSTNPALLSKALGSGALPLNFL